MIFLCNNNVVDCILYNYILNEENFSYAFVLKLLMMFTSFLQIRLAIDGKTQCANLIDSIRPDVTSIYSVYKVVGVCFSYSHTSKDLCATVLNSSICEYLSLYLQNSTYGEMKILGRFASFILVFCCLCCFQSPFCVFIFTVSQKESFIIPQSVQQGVS